MKFLIMNIGVTRNLKSVSKLLPVALETFDVNAKFTQQAVFLQ